MKKTMLVLFAVVAATSLAMAQAGTIDQNTDTITLRGVIPNPVLIAAKPGQPTLRELTDQEFVTVLLEGVQPVTVLAIPRRSGD